MHAPYNGKVNMASYTDILKRGYAKWHESKGGSVDDWMEIFDDQIEFRSLAMGRQDASIFTAPRSSKDEVRGYFDGLVAEWDMIHYTVDRYIEQDGSICAVGSTAWTNKRTGKIVETPKVDVWRFENGKAVSFFEYYDTAALFAAAQD